MKEKRMIGVVGGVGSYAGVDLVRKIYDHTGARSDQEHLPVVMLSVPHKIVDRTRFLLHETDENPGDRIGEIIVQLHTTGAEVIGVPCNTAHAPTIFERIRRATPPDCTVLHMVEEVATHIRLHFPGLRKVGILSTNGTFISNVYPETLAAWHVQAIHPSVEIQYMFVHPAIYDPSYGIKAFSNPVQERAKSDLRMAASYLVRKGAEAVILACTEIPLALNEEQVDGCPLIDATAVLARALIRESTK